MNFGLSITYPREYKFLERKSPDEDTECTQNLFAVLDTYNSEIQESVLNTDSHEVATTIARYIAKQLAN